MSDEEEREALMARVQSAGTTSEVDAVPEKARGWLRNHPENDRVAAAMQRLEEREERLREPEDASGWAGVALSVAVFAVAALAIRGVVYALSGRWALSVIAGVMLGLEAAWWSLLLAGRMVRNRSGR